jgi:hypothetical protein
LERRGLYTPAPFWLRRSRAKPFVAFPKTLSKKQSFTGLLYKKKRLSVGKVTLLRVKIAIARREVRTAKKNQRIR